ncbi:extracellular solute-binding protein [Paenibacillus sp. LMG 31458]|uniref:Extracellular solute-binding protein n=1 Tax=Paenibacillus phytorum TaxID=2654977 RepID=A0ABX1XRR8_9BACL|nr:extracellular solute-binding protein [Paenibacillus phytorum]NOU71232.1 extracellular solute-binding protein [Paenibacillus phytorum]
MKKILNLSLAMIITTALTGCGSSTSSNNSSNASVTASAAPTKSAAETPAAKEKPAELSVLVFETPNLTAQYWDAAIKRFTDKHPNIKVNKIVSPDTDRTKYAKQLLATGQFPDVLMSVTVQDFLASKSIMPFEDQYVKKVPGAEKQAIDGKVYQLAWGAQTIPYIYYNKKMFAAAGATEPKTWSEFVDVTAKLKNSGVTPLLYGGAKDAWSTTFLLDGIISADVYGKVPDWVNKRKKGEVKFSDPLFKNAVLKWKSLYDSKSFNEDGLSIDYSKLQEAFLKGKGAMYPMGSWFVAAADGQKDIEVGVFPVPTEDGSIINAYAVGGPASVSASTKFPTEAQMFATEFVTDPVTVAEVVKSDALIPLEGQKVDFKYSPLFQKVIDISNQGKKVNAFGWENGDAAMIAGMTDEINKAAQNIILGKSVDAELATLDKKWDEIAARAK